MVVGSSPARPTKNGPIAQLVEHVAQMFSANLRILLDNETSSVLFVLYGLP